MEKTTVHIKGMHCRSCEILIEDELLKIKGVGKAVVNHAKGTAEIYHKDGLDQNKVCQVIKDVGYSVGKDEKSFFSRNPYDYLDLLTALGILIFIYFLASALGIFKLINAGSGDYTNLGFVLIIGLTAGFSTCMALVGGLVLGASARFAEKHPTATSLQKFKPHLFFNLGRITSYLFFGAIIGFIGSFIEFSPLVLGVLTIIVGLVMFLLGTQLIEIFPKLRNISITLPKSITRLIGIQEQSDKEYSHRGSMILGALTFFLPCGFTQAIQLYAMSTGDPVVASVTMGIFAIGTAPGLLGVGGLTSVVKGAFAKSFFRFAGLVVIALAIFNISNGYNLTGLNLALPFTAKADTLSADPNVVFENGTQIVRMTQDAQGYSPNSFTIKKGVPVKWIITSNDVNTCASSLISSALGVRQILDPGENVIEFTPGEEGQIRFSCSMGMFTGVFNVVNGNSENPGPAKSVQKVQNPSANGPQGGSCGSSGGCGCGSTNTKSVEQSAPAPADQDGEIQVIKTVFKLDSDISPNNFTVKAGKPVRMEIDVKENGQGCMSSIMIPGLVSRPQLLTAGEPIVFNFTPQKSGKYNITCAMGMPRGVIRVE